MRKNPHAVALGRRGGQANTTAQQAARRENGRKGGQRRKYRLDPVENMAYQTRDLQVRYHEHWLTIYPPYTRAQREALRRLKA